MSLWRTRFGTLGILRFGCDRCFKIKPLRAVYGNIDDAKARMEFPLHNRFMCEGVEVWITHMVVTGKYNPAIKRRWLQIHPNYLFVDIHFEGDVR
jgi:predicted phosphodiesterase